MAEVLLFHHALGLTPGITTFAGTLREAGHTVHTPDLFEGRTFGSIPDGMGLVRELGFDEGDIDAAREIVAASPDAELFLYPGDQHYFADSTLPSYDPAATALLTERVLAFLEKIR